MRVALLLALIILAAGLAGCLNSANEGEIADLESKNDDLGQRLNESLEHAISLQEQIDLLQTQADLVPELQEQTTNLSARIQQMIHDITHLNGEIIVLERNLSQSLNDSATLRNELESAESGLADALAEIENLRDDNEISNETIQTLEEEIESLEENISSLEDQIQLYQTRIELLESERDYYQDRVEELEGTIESLEEDVQDLINSQVECGESTYEDDGVCRSSGIIWVNMPFEAGFTANITQSHHGYYSHNGAMLYAVDFPVPENTSIAAALPGIVIQVIEHNTGGCPSAECANQSNLVIVDHGDSTFGVYAHLSHNGSLVNVGESVHQGQPIALSGNTGWSTGPHLHFEVKDVYGQSMPIRFHELAPISNGVAYWGASVYSNNTQSGQGINHVHSLCDDELFLPFGIILDSGIPCSVAQLDTSYTLQGWTLGPAGKVGIAKYDIVSEQWNYNCYVANSTGWFDISLRFSSTVYDEAVYFMVYSADANCVSYQAWDASIGLWLV